MKLTRVVRAYTDADHSTQHQLAIPFDTIKQIKSTLTFNQAAEVWQDLTLLAFFFALRRCEYLHVGSPQLDKPPERRTHPLRKRNIRFWGNHKLVDHKDPDIHLSDAVTLDFEFQKADRRDESVTQTRSGDPIFCPVIAAAKRVKHMQKGVDNGSLSNDSFVFTYIEDTGKIGHFTSKIAITLLRAAVAQTDYEAIGLTLPRIGLHSLRTSAAMAMYINKIPVDTIKLLGRWSSDAFLRYIRPHTEQFNLNVAQIMTQQPLYHRIRPATHHRTHFVHNNNGPNGLSGNTFSVWNTRH